jgi:dolichol-phosphate mannosyltransferase
MMKVSVVIPAHNEEATIAPTVRAIAATLDAAGRDHDIVVVDDSSTDGTGAAVAALAERNPRIRCVRSPYPNGFGFAVRAGLERFEGDAVAIMMGDGSDDPRDMLRCFELIEEGYDCAFGSRFLPGGSVRGYPRVKLVLNRIVNLGIRALFRHGYDDTTNAFKAYRRTVIENVQPLVSQHFNITVELPLKAVVRGHSYGILPISWVTRAAGESKLGLREMGSRYLYIVLLVFLEQHLTRGDYRRADYRDDRPRHGIRARFARRRQRDRPAGVA